MISDFLFGGVKTYLPSLEGERQTKSGTDQKTYLAKVVRSAHITIENDLGFLIWGVQDMFAFPRRGKANEKLLGWKNLFCES